MRVSINIIKNDDQSILDEWTLEVPERGNVGLIADAVLDRLRQEASSLIGCSVKIEKAD